MGLKRKSGRDRTAERGEKDRCDRMRRPRLDVGKAGTKSRTGRDDLCERKAARSGQLMGHRELDTGLAHCTGEPGRSRLRCDVGTHGEYFLAAL